MSTDTKLSLTMKVLIAMLLGIIVGLFFNLSHLNSEGSFVNTYIVNGVFYIIGKMFINALKMLVVPLVFFSLISGVCGIGDLKTLGRVGTKSFILYREERKKIRDLKKPTPDCDIVKDLKEKGISLSKQALNVLNNTTQFKDLGLIIFFDRYSIKTKKLNSKLYCKLSLNELLIRLRMNR